MTHEGLLLIIKLYSRKLSNFHFITRSVLVIPDDYKLQSAYKPVVTNREISEYNRIYDAM